MSVSDHEGGEILQSIYRAIESLNLQREASDLIATDREEVLTGQTGRLDSLSLVLLLSLVEEEIAKSTGGKLNLFDDLFLSSDLVADLTVGKLADHITRQGE